MNLPADISIFAVALAVNLVLFGTLLSGGLAVTLRFSENASPRLRYLASIIVFLMAVFIPLAATLLASSAEQKNVAVYVESKTGQVNESADTAQPHRVLSDKSADAELPPTPETNRNFASHFVLIVTDSLAGNVFCVIWFLGSFLLGLRELIGIRQLTLSKKYWMRAGALQQDELGCPRNALLYLADDQSPGTSGWLRPKIVLPREFPIEISLESKRFIVRHELSHARWRDPLVRFLLRAIRNILWISPALWLIERLIQAECEAAADRAAIDSTAENRNYQLFALDYAETLLTIAKSLKPTGCRKRQSQLIGIGAEGDLEIRIRRLLTSCRVTRRQIGAAICACLLTALTTSLIPAASFSEVVKASSEAQDFLATNSQNIFSVAGIENLTGDTGSVILMQSESAIDDHELIRWQHPLPNSANTNSGLAEKTSVAGLNPKRDDPSDYRLGDDSRAEAVRMLNNENARETEAGESQRSAFGSPQTLENSPAINAFSRETNCPESLGPARRSPPILGKSVELTEQPIAKASAARDSSFQVPAPASFARREANDNYMPAPASAPAAISPLTRPNVIRPAPFSGFRQLSGFRGINPAPAQPSEP